MTRMVTDGGPQADFVGERGLMIDDWLLIIRTALIFRGAHQAKASSSQAHQATQVLHTLSIKRGVHQAAQVSGY